MGYLFTQTNPFTYHLERFYINLKICMLLKLFFARYLPLNCLCLCNKQCSPHLWSNLVVNPLNVNSSLYPKMLTCFYKTKLFGNLHIKMIRSKDTQHTTTGDFHLAISLLPNSGPKHKRDSIKL